MQPDAPVEEREVVVAVARRVERGDAREAPAVEQLVDDAVELARQPVEREVVAPELQRVGALRLGRRPARRRARRGRPRSDAASTTSGRRCRRPATRPPVPARAALAHASPLVCVLCSSRPRRSVASGPHEPPGQRARGLAVSVRDLPGDDRGAVALGALHESLAPGGQVVGHDRRLAAQALEVDDVEVGLQACRHDAAVVQPTARGGRLVSCSTTRPTSMRPCERSRAQCDSAYVGKLASEMRPTWAPPSPSPKTVSGWASISPQASRFPSA